MAQSLAHRWGQIIGETFEAFVRGVLEDVAKRHNLFLDMKGPRRARGRQLRVNWRDVFGNDHSLDYVLERGGSEDSLGIPVAFIESVWRRYTKHSKNKAQEIEAAVLPLAQTFARHQPFCGAVIAGEFTVNALRQLKSKGFAVLHIPYDSILEAFRAIGIDAASEDGVAGTSEEEFRLKVERWESMPPEKGRTRFIRKLNVLCKNEIGEFVDLLDAAITRRIVSVRLTVLRGHAVECSTVSAAIAYLLDDAGAGDRRKTSEKREIFEIQVRFNNDARIDASFPSRQEAVSFLRGFEDL